MSQTAQPIDWQLVEDGLDSQGFADLGPLIDLDTCQGLIGDYDNPALYRSHIRMARHGFGQGEYKYYQYPLPEIISGLRGALYEPLAAIANDWNTRLKKEFRFPDTHEKYLKICHAAGQLRPTALILKYGAGDYNCLHQDQYGDELFPFQVVFLLSDEDAFEGGEFVMTEQRPRMQSRALVLQLKRGHGYVFTVNERPKSGAKGWYRVKHRHGVSELHSGERYTMGVIFHDAT